MSKSLIHLFLATMILALVLTGCAGNLRGAAGDAQGAVCQALGKVAAPLDRLAEVNAETTASDAKELKANADETMEVVRTANDRLKAERISDLLATYDELSRTIDEIPDDATLGDAVPKIQSSVAEVRSALDQATAALNCDQ
jgi:hypothetical protein